MKKLLILFIILFISCSSHPPKWYNKIYSDNNQFIYATGVSKTKKEAINTALANASSKIAITIKSSYKSLKYSYKDSSSSTYSSNSILNIETKTNPLTFTNYKILKLEKKDKYYVLIKIDRYKNAKFMCNNIHINTNYEDLDIFLKYKKLLKNINKKIEMLKNINALYPICKEKLKKAILFKKYLEKKLNTITFNIISNDKEIKNIISSIIKFNISPKANIKIFAYSKYEYKIVGNYKISIIKLTLQIKNTKEKNFEITCAGSSIQDYETAKLLAYKECKEKLKKIFNN